jgi:hypothetical protein
VIRLVLREDLDRVDPWVAVHDRVVYSAKEREVFDRIEVIRQRDGS